jgi:hypothetical protein
MSSCFWKNKIHPVNPVKKYFGFISFRFSAPPFFAQKIVHAAQKNVHPNLLIILNVNNIRKLVSGMLVAI